MSDTKVDPVTTTTAPVVPQAPDLNAMPPSSPYIQQPQQVSVSYNDWGKAAATAITAHKAVIASGKDVEFSFPPEEAEVRQKIFGELFPLILDGNSRAILNKILLGSKK